MRNGRQTVVQWILLVGLGGVLTIAGCSTHLGVSATSGTEGKPPAAEVVQAPPLMAAKAEPAPPVASRPLGDVYFAFDRWALTKEGKKALDQNAEVLKEHPTDKLLIEGHCDERGSREYNLVLGEKRAQATRRYLEALGITNPVSVTSYGKERPVCTEQNESCYWKNRRAHLVLQ
jgi:peptidoglycan-associated lipoprotein